MATKSGRLSDPTGAGGGQINVMPSGLEHTADSLAGGREGTVITRFGVPGNPMESSRRVSSGYMGKATDLAAKFFRKGQR